MAVPRGLAPISAHALVLQQPAFPREPAAIFDQRTIGADQAMTANALSLLCLEISPTMKFESCQTRRHEGKIVCPGNQKTQIEQCERSLPWVPCRHGDGPLATIDHGRSEAVRSPAPCLGSDVIRAKDQAQVCFRHINPQIYGRRALGYGFDNCNEMFAFGETSG